MTDAATTELTNGPGGPNSARRALLAIRDLRAELDSLRGGGQPIAIVGMACRFPGAPGLDAFWKMLCEERDGVSEVPPERWNSAQYYHPDPKAPGKIATRRGGFLDELDRFDAAFFGISPREAPHVDPRQRKMLEVAWEALEDAGIPPHSLAGSATGVYVATLSNDYDLMFCRNYRRFSASTGTGTANSIIANRVSYFLDLHGPSLTLDTACSGSLLTIELACRSLRAGETSLALAGGVSLNLLPKGDIFFSSAGALSPQGSCRTFDAAADGIVRSEGAGMIALKRLDDALQDGDRIYAVIRGGAVNHDGSSNGIMAPNAEAQKRVLREAYRNAGVAPGDVHYVEAHGTGTPLGDPIEVSALSAVMGDRRNGLPLLLGSLKTNVGHMEAAAGVAGVIKAALALHHKAIPPNRGFENWNPRISQPPFRLEVSSALRDWPSGDHRRIAGVSAFSFGGTNAHLVLEEARDAVEPVARAEGRGAFVLPLSAKSPEGLRDTTAAWREYLEASSDSLQDICYTAGVRRAHHPHRMAVIGSSAAEMAAQLAVAGEAKPAGRVNKLAFVFSGQGSQWPGMGMALVRTEPVFRATLEACDGLFAERTGWSVIDEIRRGVRIDDTEVGQPAVFSIQAALADLWRSWGIHPDAVIGQSLGEAAAAYAAGALSLESAVAVVHHRSRLMKTLAGQGKTAVVGLSPEAVRETLAEWDGALHIAGISGPQTTVIAGAPFAIDAMLAAMDRQGTFGREIPGIDIAFHSPHMEPLRADLEQALNGLDVAPAQTGMMSTVTAQWLNGSPPDGSYWGRNLCEPFQFHAAVRQVIAEGFNGFLEIGPSTLLAGTIRQIAAVQNAEVLTFASMQRNEGAAGSLLHSLAALYGAGLDLNWAALYPVRGRTVSIPHYRWQRERYWLDQLPGGDDVSESHGGHPLLGAPIASALPAGERFWQRNFDAASPHYLSAHRVFGSVIFPGAGFLEAAAAAMRQLQGEAGAVEISDLRFMEPLTLLPDASKAVQLAFSPAAGGRYRFRFSARDNESTSWTLHAGGVAALAPLDPPAVAIAEIRQRCKEPIEARIHYEAMGAQGLDYGDAFRVIRRIWRAPGEAVADIELGEGTAPDAAEYRVHPILIDAAMQLVAAAITPVQKGPYSRESYLPHGIERARYYRNPGDRTVCVARLHSGRPGDAELRADIQVLDTDGEVCLAIDGLVLKHVGSKPAGARGKLRDWLYDLCWEENRRDSVETSSEGAWTIVADEGGVADGLASEMRSRGVECTVERPAGADQPPAHGAHVVWLRGLDDSADPSVPLLEFVKREAQSGGAARSIWIVTRETQAAGGRAPRLSGAAQLWGFGRVVALEHPELWGGMLDLAGTDRDDIAQLADELLAPGVERQVAFYAGRRYVARLRPWPESPQQAPCVFHSDAAYLITGGMGGLGIALARWMVERGARRLILAGRSPLPARSEWRALPEDHPARPRVDAVRELESLGASVHTPSFDVADRDEVKRFIDGFHAEGWPQIRGVFHAAGVVEDQLMLRLDPDSVRRVLRPKVAGAQALHEATLDLNLDFFTLFSSASSVLGQFGQAAYAAGNAYMDHLAHWRRAQGLPATAINWGPWAEIGLYARSSGTDKTGRSGVYPMLPHQGLQAMELIHTAAPTQIVVISAEWSRIPPSPLLSEVAPRSAAGDTADDRNAAAALLIDLLLASPEERQTRLEEVLQTAAANVLGLDPARLDIREPLTSFGMDSVMVVELRNYIEKTMNLSISMVDLFTGSVAKLAEQVADKLADSPQLEELLTQVENMSPDQIQAFLGEESESQQSSL
jgi:myxalamid-type polyketide synthase MxaE and MxaD